MKHLTLGMNTILALSLGLQAETLSTDQNSTQHKIKPASVRKIVNTNNPIAHSTLELRLGYIGLNGDGQSRTNAYGLGGHYHLDSKRWNGFMVGISAYTVLDLGINQNPQNVNGDFFDADGKSFIMLSEIFLDGKWGNTGVKFGRQMLDTPHADSDDIRMIPNYFEAYTITNNDIDNVTLSAGFIHEMAGWENGVDASKFVNIGETLGTNGVDINGVSYASINYEGIKDLSLALWYYNYNDIANVVYAELGYEKTFNNETTLTFGLQYDGSKETGAALLGEQNAETYGVSADFIFESTGVHLLAAYNQDNGSTGATGLSLGGGPFFTSMEDQTLDAIGEAGSAWVLGAEYHFEKIGIDGLHLGIAYGHFEAKDTDSYESDEVDVIMGYTLNKNLSLTAAYASVKFNAGTDENGKPLTDYDQFRLIVNYNY